MIAQPARLWMMVEAIASVERRVALADAVPPRFAVVNRDAAFSRDLEVRAAHPDWSEDRVRALVDAEVFVPRLRITEPGFAPHLFVDGALIVSGALRSAADLSEAVVRCGPVDSSDCTDLGRDRHYTTWQPLLSADPIDQDASDGEWVDWIEDDGRLGKRWMLATGPNRPSPRVVFKSDFEPPAPLFSGTAVGGVLVTEALAERILAAGIEDVAFVKMDGERGRTEIEYRPPWA